MEGRAEQHIVASGDFQPNLQCTGRRRNQRYDREGEGSCEAFEVVEEVRWIMEKQMALSTDELHVSTLPMPVQFEGDCILDNTHKIIYWKCVHEDTGTNELQCNRIKKYKDEM